MDRGDGGECFGVGLVELAEADVYHRGRGGVDRAVFDAGRNKVADDRGVGLALGVIRAGHDEVE